MNGMNYPNNMAYASIYRMNHQNSTAYPLAPVMNSHSNRTYPQTRVMNNMSNVSDMEIPPMDAYGNEYPPMYPNGEFTLNHQDTRSLVIQDIQVNCSEQAFRDLFPFEDFGLWGCKITSRVDPSTRRVKRTAWLNFLDPLSKTQARIRLVNECGQWIHAQAIAPRIVRKLSELFKCVSMRNAWISRNQEQYDAFMAGRGLQTGFVFALPAKPGLVRMSRPQEMTTASSQNYTTTSSAGQAAQTRITAPLRPMATSWMPPTRTSGLQMPFAMVPSSAQPPTSASPELAASQPQRQFALRWSSMRSTSSPESREPSPSPEKAKASTRATSFSKTSPPRAPTPLAYPYNLDLKDKIRLPANWKGEAASSNNLMDSDGTEENICTWPSINPNPPVYQSKKSKGKQRAVDVGHGLPSTHPNGFTDAEDKRGLDNIRYRAQPLEMHQGNAKRTQRTVSPSPPARLFPPSSSRNVPDRLRPASYDESSIWQGRVPVDDDISGAVLGFPTNWSPTAAAARDVILRSRAGTSQARTWRARIRQSGFVDPFHGFAVPRRGASGRGRGVTDFVGRSRVPTAEALQEMAQSSQLPIGFGMWNGLLG
jgi:hypothetical protein